ncbi:MAG TPA: prepilin-type N-terminal cleavage/methylation domain-containing protein [Planctomycetota bacterium]|nr:prepilin-type N-terminal cleavage/methylation domain-containing protein [Planctomycetota bacterium]HRR82684.1 prepilin-type N-terminal cleavage/methylation domain-containing protein [Planctomycetota bacterium]HRT93923.1 prepilin-type N-terminal cleavage/methylation domain-containing protein [Planctomycetota bacterium]
MNAANRERGFTLMEVMTYIAVLGVMTTVAWLAYYACVAHSLDLLRNVDDITRAVKAGERWREDVRRAIAPLRVADGALHIPQAEGEVVYRLAGAAVTRRGPEDPAPRPFLARVNASRMERDAGKAVASWRWEVELTGRERARLRPLFTFRAVPTAAGAR